MKNFEVYGRALVIRRCVSKRRAMRLKERPDRCTTLSAMPAGDKGEAE
jgi:hypothetical protein